MVCKTSQKNGEKNLTYGKLTAKKVWAIAWNRLLVNLIGPYKIRR